MTSCLLEDGIRNKEVINFTQNRIFLLKVFHFLLYRLSNVPQDSSIAKKKFGKLSVREILVVTSTYIRKYVLSLGVGEGSFANQPDRGRTVLTTGKTNVSRQKIT